jgi:hypothetical protein
MQSNLPVGVAKLPLYNSERFALVDEIFLEKISDRSWGLLSIGYCGFFLRSDSTQSNSRMVYLHRVIMKLAGHSLSGKLVDHINMNPLDNRIENLRVATKAQNMSNRPAPANNTSGYKGVSLHKQTGKWRAIIKHNYKQIALGLYHTKEEAALAYNKAALEIQGDFAYLNVIK